MQSLRKKKIIKDPRPRANVALVRGDARKSRVDDKIKKRMSTRYADISGPTVIPHVPRVPALPMNLRPLEEEEEKDVEDIHGYRQNDAPSQVVDLAVLRQSDFNPESCRCRTNTHIMISPKYCATLI